MYLAHVCTGGRYQQAISKVSSALTVLDTWNVLGSLWVANCGGETFHRYLPSRKLLETIKKKKRWVNPGVYPRCEFGPQRRSAVGKDPGSEIRQVRLLIPALLLAGCVTTGKSLGLPGPHVLHLQNRTDDNHTEHRGRRQEDLARGFLARCRTNPKCFECLLLISSALKRVTRMHTHSAVPSGQPAAGPNRARQQHFACENILVQFSDPRKYFYSENARLEWGCSVSLACLASRENKQKRICGRRAGARGGQTQTKHMWHLPATSLPHAPHGRAAGSEARPLDQVSGEATEHRAGSLRGAGARGCRPLLASQKG